LRCDSAGVLGGDDGERLRGRGSLRRPGCLLISPCRDGTKTHDGNVIDRGLLGFCVELEAHFKHEFKQAIDTSVLLKLRKDSQVV